MCMMVLLMAPPPKEVSRMIFLRTALSFLGSTIWFPMELWCRNVLHRGMDQTALPFVADASRGMIGDGISLGDTPTLSCPKPAAMAACEKTV